MKITTPDTSREDVEYWERVLESHGLGIRQLGLEEEEIDEDDENEDSEGLDLVPLDEVDFE